MENILSEMKIKNILTEQKKATFWYFVANVIQKFSTFLVIPLYTRIFSLEEYGIYTITDSWMEILLVITSLNLYQNTFNVAVKKYDDKNGVASAFCGLSIFITAIFCLILFVLEKVFIKILNANQLILIAYCIFLLSSPIVSIWYTMKRYFYEYKALIVCALGKTIIFILLGFLMFFLKQNQAIYAIYVKSITEFIIAVIVLIDILKKNCRLFNMDYWIFALKMAVPLIPYYISLRILQHLDRIMIGRICGEVSAAKYGLTYKISGLTMMINTSVNGAYTPWLYTNMGKNRVKIRKTYQMLVVVILLFNVSISLFAPEIIAVLGASGYGDAVYVIPPILLSAVFIFIYDQFVNIELYYERNRWNAVFAISASALNAILNGICILRYGYLAAGYTTLISYLLFMIMHRIYIVYLLKKNRSEDLFSNVFLFIIIILCLGMSVFIPMLYEQTIMRYIVILILIVTTLNFYRIVRNTKHEKN